MSAAAACFQRATLREKEKVDVERVCALVTKNLKTCSVLSATIHDSLYILKQKFPQRSQFSQHLENASSSHETSTNHVEGRKEEEKGGKKKKVPFLCVASFLEPLGSNKKKDQN